MRRSRSFAVLPLLLALIGGQRADAHIGAPDVYLKTTAGPYHLLIAVHPPATVPGAASIDIRTEDTSITAILVDGNALQRFPQEQIFTGSLWFATTSARSLTIHVSGDRGEAGTSVSIPATAPKPTNKLARTGFLVGLLMLPAILASRFKAFRRWSTPLSLVSGVACLLLILYEFAAPTKTMKLDLLPEGKLRIEIPGKADDLVEDHGKLMHLFLIRQPQMDVLLHLHPTQTAPGRFEVELPSMAPGAFTVFADVVHRDGTMQTFTANAGLPLQTGHILVPDDSIGIVPPLNRSIPGSTTTRLMDGYTMSLTLASALHPRIGQLLRFSLQDPSGQPPKDMQLYLGMPAHAVVIKTDNTVFAHIHPDGTSAMTMPMQIAPASEVSFPFGFPTAGSYRIFVQMKHGSIIETAAFDLNVQ